MIGQAEMWQPSEPDGAFLFEDGELWEAILNQDLFNQAAGFPPPGSDSLLPGVDVGTPGPSTCASQAARANAAGLTSRALGVHPNRLSITPRAAPTTRAVPSSVLSDIAGLYAASTPQSRARQTLLAAETSGGRHGQQLVWAPVRTTQCHPVNQIAVTSANYTAAEPRSQGHDHPLTLATSLDLSGACFAPVPPLVSAALNTWTPVTTGGPAGYTAVPSGINTTATALDNLGDGRGGLSDVCHPSWPTTSLPANTNTLIKVELGDTTSGRRDSTSSAVAVVPKARPTSQEPERSQNQANPASSLPIVQWKPAAGTKRPAMEEITPQGVTSQMLRKVDVVDDQGNCKGTMYTFGNRIKTRGVFSEEKRQQTALARREGVCGRCKKSKRLCDLAQKLSPYVSCSLCAGTRIYKNAPRMPCFKATLQDILFFRSGPARNEPFYTSRSTVYQLKDMTKPNAPVRTLRLTQQIGPHQLTVYASEFTPVPGDVVSYKWRDRATGAPRELKMPHFCLTNIDKIHSHFLQYIAQAKWSYLESLEKDDELAWMTVSMAMAYAKKRPNSLVATSLDLWAISRMIEIPWQMCGADTLGVSAVRDPTSPHHGKIPIPPTMDTQLDQVVIQFILKPLRQAVVEKFEQLITPAKPETWWEVYLSSFILLNHIERLARHSVAHARTHTMKTKYSNTQFLEAVFHTAKSILARFHFVCNGSVPLRLDWTSPKMAAMAKLDREQVEFMRRTQAMVAMKEQQVLRLRASHQYERTLYWCGQLFTETFDTSPVHVVEEEVVDLGQQVGQGPELPPDRSIDVESIPNLGPELEIRLGSLGSAPARIPACLLPAIDWRDPGPRHQPRGEEPTPTLCLGIRPS
ncbi:hypothetical protein VTJ49DRAFT_668 [Mycothermus thermophilus]|uniref:Zn(2)-C6 fungal-type domain-containing protein n=1 Tax=Humicola insolens TaxID=85995 RepID=A0ABR3VEK5_HUMIN